MSPENPVASMFTHKIPQFVVRPLMRELNVEWTMASDLNSAQNTKFFSVSLLLEFTPATFSPFPSPSHNQSVQFKVRQSAVLKQPSCHNEFAEPK